MSRKLPHLHFSKKRKQEKKQGGKYICFTEFVKFAFLQAKALLKFVEAISEKTLRSTVAMTAARGRGKSAALGLAIATAVGFGYSNIFVTSPSPENLKTLFEFIFKGFDALEYQVGNECTFPFGFKTN